MNRKTKHVNAQISLMMGHGSLSVCRIVEQMGHIVIIFSITYELLNCFPWHYFGLYSHRQWTMVLISIYPLQHLLLHFLMNAMVVWMEMVPADSYVWRFDLQLVELFGKDAGILLLGAGFAISKDLSNFSLCILLKNQDVCS